MSQAITTLPLFMDEAGVFRVADTRVSLDSVIYAFEDGATPEEIVLQYPTLDLAAVYSVIGYYLQNRAEAQQYLEQRKILRRKVRHEIETRSKPNGLRKRLLARSR